MLYGDCFIGLQKAELIYTAGWAIKSSSLHVAQRAPLKVLFSWSL